MQTVVLSQLSYLFGFNYYSILKEIISIFLETIDNIRKIHSIPPPSMGKSNFPLIRGKILVFTYAAFLSSTWSAGFGFSAFFDGSFIYVRFTRSWRANSSKEAEAKSVLFALRKLVGRNFAKTQVLLMLWRSLKVSTSSKISPSSRLWWHFRHF